MLSNFNSTRLRMSTDRLIDVRDGNGEERLPVTVKRNQVVASTHTMHHLYSHLPSTRKNLRHSKPSSLPRAVRRAAATSKRGKKKEPKSRQKCAARQIEALPWDIGRRYFIQQNKRFRHSHIGKPICQKQPFTEKNTFNITQLSNSDTWWHRRSRGPGKKKLV